MKKLLLMLTSLTAPLSHAAVTHVPKDLFIKYLPSNPIILEAGAQFGEDTQWMSELWPEAVIHAFEPLQDNYVLLENLAKSKHNIFCYKLALSDKKGTAPFYVAGGASSLLKPAASFNQLYFHADLHNPLIVETVTLDEWASSNGVSHIDFMWLDMEGNELHVLKSSGMMKTTTLIYIEVNLQTFWENCARYEEVKAFLSERGFEEIWAEITPNWQGNALYLNKNK